MKNKNITFYTILVRIFVLAFLSSLSITSYGCGNDTKVQLSSTLGNQSQEDLSKNDITSENDMDSSTDENANIYVYVCGAVKNKGVYEIPAGSRIADALGAAGGALDNADLDNINLADLAEDGMQIRIPYEGEQAAADSSSVNGNTANSESSGKVNINKASKEELMTLSGIGESKANLIINYREENGAFSKIEDLMKIEGIKEGVFNKIKDDISVK